MASSPDALRSVAMLAGEEVFSQLYIKKHATHTILLVWFLYDNFDLKEPDFQIFHTKPLFLKLKQCLKFASSRKKNLNKRVLLNVFYTISSYV